MSNSKLVIRSIIDDQGIEKRYIDFYPAVFNQLSKQIFEDGRLFYEVIESGAFDNVINDSNINCKAVLNHDEGNLLGRTTSGTLQLSIDEYGLKASLLVGNTTLWRDVLEMIERGDLYECSFKSLVKNSDQFFTRDDKGNLICKVRNISKLFDVSIVNDGAYKNTNIKLRSLEEFLQAEEIERNIKDEIKQELTNYRNIVNQIKNEVAGIN